MKFDMKLIIGPRPGKKSKDTIQAAGVTHVLTLLSEREDAAASGRITRAIGAEWLHLPMEGGHLDRLATFDTQALWAVLDQVPEAATLYIHCSAGIHRTGFVTYLILRRGGLPAPEARVQLGEIRPVTLDQVGEDRLALAEHLFQEGLAEPE